ncbi:MAG: PEP-CTERM sorting domain-containing protein [Planctomycetota bacterium]|nr:PEP-CTERM sorting domain-containing protein [Planctomycetota bacterium]
MKRTLLAVVVSLLMAASAQAAFLDAISINISSGGTGDVLGAAVGANGDSANNWINTAYSPLRGATGGALSGTSSNGEALSGFKVSLYNGGWNSGVSAWIEASAADNTPGKNGWNMGHMANTSWGAVRGDLQLWNVPADFAAAGYNVYALAGYSQTSLTWRLITDVAPLTTTNPGRIFGSQSSLAGTGLIGGQTSPANDWRVAAYQIVAIPEPATMSLLVLGGVATLIRRRNRR